MALSTRELLLIVRAQNQASAALRRVAGDMKSLGRIQDLNLRRNALAIQQANTVRQRMRAEQALADVTTGRRALQAEAERLRLQQRAAITARNMRTTVRDLGTAEADMARLRNAGVSRSVKSYQKLQSQSERLRSRLAAQTNVLRSMPAAWEANTARMANNAAMASRLHHELQTLTQRQVATREKMRLLDQEIRATRWDRAIVGARTFAHAGRIAQLSGLAVGAGLAFAADAAVKFQQKAQLVATQTGRVGSGFQVIIRNADVLRDRILTTMADSTASMETLTDAAYDIFSSLTLPDGGRGLKAGTDMLQQFSDAAIAGMTDVDTAGEGVIAILNAFEEFRPTGEDVNRILNRMFAAVRFGRMTFGEFAATLGTTAPAARAAGQSLDTMAGTIAFLSRPLGINKAAVGFARLTEIIGRKAFVKGLRDAGVEIVDSSGKLLQLPEIIDKVTKKFPELTKGGVKLVQFFKKMSGTEGTIQARRAFVFLAQQMDQYRTVLGQTVNDNNEFDRSLKAMSETAGVQWQKALNSLRVLMIEIGAAVVPVLVQILEPVQDLTKWFSELDDETKNQIGRWMAWSAVILLVGGTLAVIVGTIGSMIGQLARLGVLWRSSIILVLAVSAAIVALTGDFESLQNIASSAMDFFTGSWEGFILGATLAAASVVKLASSFRSLRATIALTAGAQAAGVLGPAGFLPALIRAPGNLKAYGSSVREAAKGTNIATKAVAGAGAALSLMPLSIAAVLGGLAAFGGAALVWRAHSAAMAEESQRLAEEQEELAKALSEVNQAAGQFAGFGPALTDFKRARLDIADINASIKELRKQMKGARGEDRASLSRQIQRLILDRADAQEVLAAATGKATNALSSFNRFLKEQSQVQGLVVRKEQQIRNIRREISTLTAPDPEKFPLGPPEAQIQKLRAEITRLTGDIMELESGSRTATESMAQSFTTAVRDLQRMGELPRNISDAAIRDALQLQVRMGRVLTRKEMRMFFRAEIDPQSLRNLPKKIQTFIRGQKRDRVEMQADIKVARKALGIDELQEQARKGVDFTAQLEDEKVRRQTQNLMGWFKANQNLPPFHASITPTGASLGVQMAEGIRAGFGSVNLSVHINAQMDAVRDAAARNEEAKSPSKRWAREVGLPISQGLLMGMIEGFADIPPEIKRNSKKWKAAMIKAWKEIANTAAQTILDEYNTFRDALESTFMDPIDELNELRMDWGLVLNVQELTASLNEQTAQLRDYGNDWSRLVKRGVPLDLLLQLSEMGEEGAAILNSLAGASNKDLRAYVRAWRRSQKELDKIALRQTRSQIKEWRKMGRAMAFGIMAGLRDEQQGLLNFFRNLFKSLYREAKKTNKSGSPSKLYMQEGKNIIDGLRIGMAEDLAVPQPTIGRGLVRGRSVAAGTGGNITMNINAQQNESLMTTMERARFRLKNRT